MEIHEFETGPARPNQAGIEVPLARIDLEKGALVARRPYVVTGYSKMANIPNLFSRSRLTRFCAFELNLFTGELHQHSRRIPLQPQPFKILAILVQRAGQLVTRAELRKEIWPEIDHLDFEHSLNRSMNKLRVVLNDSVERPQIIETLPGRGYRFIANISTECEGVRCGAEPVTEISARPTNGAVGLGSRYYVARAAELSLHDAIQRKDAVVSLSGPRQSGKTSALARVLHSAREAGGRVVITDCNKLNAGQLTSVDSVMRWLAEDLYDQLGTSVAVDDCWQSSRAPNMNMDRFVKTVLRDTNDHIVWAIDAAERLLGNNIGQDMLSLLCSWQDERALQPQTPFQCLTVVLSYGTELLARTPTRHSALAKIGTDLAIADFSLEEIYELNRLYGNPLDDNSIKSLFDFLGGNPYLTHAAIQHVAGNCANLHDFVGCPTPTGVVGTHLQDVASMIASFPAVHAEVTALLEGRAELTALSMHRLRLAGLSTTQWKASFAWRCRLYSECLRELI
jgi:DNA-binding winged helix-turn-helix (wHTH) protein